MNIRRAIRFVGSAIAIASISIAAAADSSTKPQRPGPADPTANRALDSIPPALFQKMFRRYKLVGSPGLAWTEQKVITVAFNGGSDDLYLLIEKTANEWTALGGQLSFSFKDGAGKYRHFTAADKSPAANIRIAFNDTGCWSLIGVLAQNADAGDATMNFTGYPEALKKYFRGQNQAEWQTSYAHTAVLHEFGHALGLSHEHFNPQCQKDLKLDTIIQFLMGPPNGWEEAQARFNMDAKFYAKLLADRAGPLESKLMNSPTADQSSVMLYVFPVSYYRSADKSVCKPMGAHGKAWPTTLSQGDKQFYLANYGNPRLPFGGPAQ